MRNDSIRTGKLAVAFAAFALALAPIAVRAQMHGDMPKAGPKGSAAEGAHGHGHMHGEMHKGDKDKPGAAAPGAAAPAAKPQPQMPSGPELAKAADGMTASCSKAADVRGRIEELAGKRKASLAALRTAQNEAKKQVRLAVAAQKKIERAVKKPGTDTAPLFEEARTALEAAVAQNASVEREGQVLRATEDELGTLAASAEEAAKACAEAEVTLRNAANEARKAATTARADSAKARGLAKLPPPKALEVARAKQASDLEALKKSSDETRGAIEALRSVAATAAAAPPPAPAKPKPAAAAKAGAPK